jgi:hypothetical protein
VRLREGAQGRRDELVELKDGVKQKNELKIRDY